MAVYLKPSLLGNECLGDPDPIPAVHLHPAPGKRDCRHHDQSGDNQVNDGDRVHLRRPAGSGAFFDALARAAPTDIDGLDMR